MGPSEPRLQQNKRFRENLKGNKFSEKLHRTLPTSNLYNVDSSSMISPKIPGTLLLVVIKAAEVLYTTGFYAQKKYLL